MATLSRNMWSQFIYVNTKENTVYCTHSHNSCGNWILDLFIRVLYSSLDVSTPEAVTTSHQIALVKVNVRYSMVGTALEPNTCQLAA